MEKMMQEIQEKLANGIRLSRHDGTYLYQQADLLSLAQMARQKKLDVSGRHVFFNVNRHINLTNICVSRCRFCAFGVDKEGPGAPYLMSIQEALEYGAAAVEHGITEFHVVSAMHPDMPLDYYVGVVRTLHDHYPNIHIQAFTAVEIAHMAKISGLSVGAVLGQLQQAGLGSMPGGGAEILNDDIRQELCPRKATSQEWLEVHRIAHQMGIRTNCTMLFGHVETIEDRIDHMLQLRELQDHAPGFQAFIPLPFLPEHTGLQHLKRTSALDDLKTIAVSRLMLDNIDHIKAFWIMLGLPIAQLALDFGADDIDGTVVEERIMHAAGVGTEKGISKEQLICLIKESGYIPTERNTLYDILAVY
ncbi:MAG TPA: aminofutalosine synthase MqnE [Syntrophomonadaceae bacterium]|nr:aminofutalosine synthase MqnE [Syntrophomonadaceae bacterium]